VSQRSEHDDELVHPLSRPFLWLDAKWFKASLFWVFGALTIGLVALDFVWPRHEAIHTAEIPGFYAGYGFIAFILAVFVGWLVIRGLLGRAENYWDGEGRDD
jgi:hypothetical protein